jgi:isoquinoline 1-oxidoreductase beta subunit
MPISRRSFLWAGTALGGGLALGIGVPVARYVARRSRRATPLGRRPWIEISSDGRVRLYCVATEMGQGAWTALAQIAAEELDADWSSVTVRMAPVDGSYAAPWGYGTGGSRSVRGMFDMMRQIGAAGRAMLVSAAANRLGVDPSECATSAGIVRHDRSNSFFRYADIAEEASRLRVPADPPLKPRQAWRLIGHSVPRVDTPGKIDGSAQFGLDVRLPGMRYAAVAHCPVPGGSVAAIEREAALASPGVEDIVVLGESVAAIARDTWSAIRGLEALQVRWRLDGLDDLSSAALLDQLERMSISDGGQLVTSRSEVPDASKPAAPGRPGPTGRLLRSSYRAPFISHAQLEPMNATARVDRLGAEIWAPTQQQALLRDEVARTLLRPVELIGVHPTLVGGGFGRRLKVDYAVEAAEIARRLEGPVQVFWSRGEDFSHGYFRPASAATFEASIVDSAGISALAIHVSSIDTDPRIGGLDDQPYRFGKLEVRYTPHPARVRFGSWRSVDLSQNTFFLECFLDEVALEAQVDPLELRRSLLAHDARAARVLDVVAEASGWESRTAAGRHLGCAFVSAFGSYCAQVVEVTRQDSGIRIEKVTAAVDPGLAVNPGNIRAQVQGAIIQALSAAIYEEITIGKGQVQQRNFDDYPIMTIANAPRIEVTVLEADDARPGGVGEIGVPAAAPAAANAIHAATGLRLRAMPFASQVGFAVT